MSRAPLKLAGRPAVVTGAGSGIGRALAMHAADAGMQLALCDVAGDDLDETVRLAGGAAISERVDVADPAAVAAFATRVRSVMPPVALVFANAGILRQASILSMPPSDWRRLFEINVIGVVNTLQAFVPEMVASGERGQIVITASTGAMAVPPGLVAYCATKHALWAIAEGLRDELDGGATGVSLLLPGAVETRIFGDLDRVAAPDSISAEAAATIAFAGIAADRFMILTHPSFVDRARARFDEVVAQLDLK